MNYATLLGQLQALPAERLLDTVTIFDTYTGEFTSIFDTRFSDPDEEAGDVLAEGAFFLIMKG